MRYMNPPWFGTRSWQNYAPTSACYLVVWISHDSGHGAFPFRPGQTNAMRAVEGGCMIWHEPYVEAHYICAYHAGTHKGVVKNLGITFVRYSGMIEQMAITRCIMQRPPIRQAASHLIRPSLRCLLLLLLLYGLLLIRPSYSL